MFRGKGGRLGRLMGLAVVAWLPFSLLTACNNDEPGVEPILPPAGVTVSISVDVDVITVSWNTATGATSYRIDLAGGATITRTATATESSAVFDDDDGIDDDVTYTATVYAINESGETVSSNAPSVTTDYFPWDEYYETSLHRTGQGKMTFYNEVPNGGFEQFTGVPYNTLACQGCHIPGYGGTVQGERGCQSCHEDDDPQLGAQVNTSPVDGKCGSTCHGRQAAEVAFGYTDAHRDAGMDCMACHTMGDLHGDGNTYASMLDDGAIDPDCTDCHTDLASNTAHALHGDNISCSACHIQSVVTCNNCHFESEVEVHQKIAYGKFHNWKFLLNRNGKVEIGNYQSVTHNGRSVVAFGPFYAHTIAKDATSCDDCHQSAAVADWFENDDHVMDIVVWNDQGTDPNGKNLTYQTGVIPIPPNFLEGGMRFDFVDLDEPGGTVWSFLKTGADIYQILYGTPMTQAQMDKLK